MTLHAFDVPTADRYRAAFASITLADNEKQMLRNHFHAHAWAATFAEIGGANANSTYGKLSRKIGEWAARPYRVPNDERAHDRDCSEWGGRKSYALRTRITFCHRGKTPGTTNIVLEHPPAATKHGFDILLCLRSPGKT